MRIKKGAENENLEQANAQVRYQVNIDDTPLSCPMTEM